MKAPARFTILVGSGKGGVGKSTVAVNLAIALAKAGYSAGLLDADVYGPSLPVMMGLRRLTPQHFVNAEGSEKIHPFTKYGIQSMSVGFFIEEAKSILWRGPLLHGILRKMLIEVAWQPMDFLIVDLPPGTGDVPISLSQLMPVHGAIVVTTPQEVAMLDAIKAINSFYQLEIPLLGIIENMSGFTAPDTGITYPIFGEGKGAELAFKFQAPLLGQIPLISSIRIGGDEGVPAALHSVDGLAGAYYADIVQNLVSTISTETPQR